MAIFSKRWSKKGNGRIRFLVVLLSILACLFVGELYFVQIVKGEEYRSRAAGQWSALSGLFDRGTVYFTERNNNVVSAAGLQNGYIIAIEPAKISDARTVYRELSDITSLDERIFIEKAGKKDDPYEEIAHRISLETKEKISALGIPGVNVYRERWRIYPGNSFAAHLLGFTGYETDGTTISGRYGIERYYNDVLDKNSINSKRNLFVEIFTDLKEAISEDSAIKGDVVLTIEPKVENMLEAKLDDIQERWHSKMSGGIIMDPKTGAIYAMALRPGFNPNDVSAFRDVSVFNNPLVENVFEMGSVVKPLAMAAGLDAGAVTAQTTYNDQTGDIIVGNARISNYDGKGRGINITMQEVLNQSLNTGMVFVMKQLGREQFSKYMFSYDLGEETGIDLPSEIHGLVDNLNSKRDVEHATAAFGQGIALTPIALIRALSSLGNGGMLPPPHLLKEVRYKAGIAKGFVPQGEQKRVLKKETSTEITKMLVEVVDKALLGGTVKLPHYSIAAKTGTAQISKGDGKGYYDDRYLHSFFGYFPAYDPKFIVLLFTIEPVGEKYASHTLTASFMDLAKFLLAYYEVPPDR